MIISIFLVAGIKNQSAKAKSNFIFPKQLKQAYQTQEQRKVEKNYPQNQLMVQNYFTLCKE
jgi:hypothetical protein